MLFSNFLPTPGRIIIVISLKSYGVIVKKLIFIVGLVTISSLLFVKCKSTQVGEMNRIFAGSDENTASLYHPGSRFNHSVQADRYLGKVQPVLAKRCVVCHGCSDSPCSLKLSSHLGIERGASKANPFAVRKGTIPFPAMKKGIKGFFSVTDKKLDRNLLFQHMILGQKNTTESDPEGPFDIDSLMGTRKKYAAKPKYSCPEVRGWNKMSEFEDYVKKNPLGGMPFGLARIADKEYTEIMTWIAETNSRGPSTDSLTSLSTPSDLSVIYAWEKFLNFNTSEGPTLRTRLMARYLYEHWFNAHIHFDEMPGEFYKIVRSNEAPVGKIQDYKMVNEIVRELPTDDPGKRKFYYRFKKVTDIIVQKSHIPLKLSKNKIENYKKLFLQDKENPWGVLSLPDYSTADPFQNFKKIPEIIRHRFMLENARYIVDNMVRAPVCTGQSATFAIADHFWAFFLKPESDPTSGAKYKMSEKGFKGLDLTTKGWTLAKQARIRFTRNYDYLNEFENALRKNLRARGKENLDMDDLWDGSPLRDGGKGQNPNAWLSITRHDTNTTVQFGHEGGAPQSLWVLTYANFERLYYNLAVNFKYWGNIKHKLGTWRSMSHERLEGEDLFISMLPKEVRKPVRLHWSGGLKFDSNYINAFAKIIRLRTGIKTPTKINRYIDLYPSQSLKKGDINTSERSPGERNNASKDEALDTIISFTKKLRDRFKKSGVLKRPDYLNANADGENIYRLDQVKVNQKTYESFGDFSDWEKAIAEVTVDRGRMRYAQFLPALTMVRVSDESGKSRVYTIVGNRGYLSHNVSLLSSSETSSPIRDPRRDTVSIYHGVVGDYPELFLDLTLEKSGGEFLNLIQKLNSGNHKTVFGQIWNNYAVKQNSSKLWDFVDWLHHYMANTHNSNGEGYIYSGVLDLSRYGLKQ